MEKFGVIAFCLALAYGVWASWYWPFGSDENGGSSVPRLSELMEPASLLIDEASDLAGDGKVDESVEKYRKALIELDRIERENPERAKTMEFATIRNKRAYVNAAIDTLLLSQVKENAKAVAVSDTTELEKKLAEERAGAEKNGEKVKEAAKSRSRSARPRDRREQAMAHVANGDFAAADALIREMLEENPNGALALNLKAMSESRQGKLEDAERTLRQAIRSNPKSHFAYYNLAIVTAQRDPGAKAAAKRLYDIGRTRGGPKDEQLEALLK